MKKALKRMYEKEWWVKQITAGALIAATGVAWGLMVWALALRIGLAGIEQGVW